MQQHRTFWFHCVFLLCTFLCCIGVAHAESGGDQSFYRIGVLAYEDLKNDLPNYRELVTRLDSKTAGSKPFRLALGSYEDLTEWMKQDFLDLAIVTPGIAAVLESQNKLGPWRYVASARLSTETDQIACYTNALTANPDLEKVLTSPHSELILVTPSSVSGAVIPLLALAEAGIAIRPEQIRFAGSHTNAQRLLVSEPLAPRVACLWKPSIVQTLAKDLSFLPLPQLSHYPIPPMVVLAREGIFQLDDLQARILKESSGRYEVRGDWNETLDRVKGWFSKVGPRLAPSEKSGLTLEGVGLEILTDIQSQPSTQRIALVLPGGGAKCSYQVGAVRALEEKLADLRAQTGNTDLNISLVVGTSGGAFNATAVALGLSETPQGFEEMATLWKELDQREILRPSFPVRANLSLWIFSIEALVLLLIYGAERNRWSHWWSPGLRAFFVVGTLQVIAGLLPGKPWELLGANPVLHKIWLWLSLGIVGAGSILVAVSLLSVLLRKTTLRVSYRAICYLLLLCVVGLPALQTILMLFLQPTLVESAGMEQAVRRNFGTILHSTLKKTGAPPLKPDATFEELGRSIFDHTLIKKDLVFTTSVLKNPEQVVPDEYYWYASGATQRAVPQYGQLGVDLSERPEQFFNILMGSGTIYPVFPARRVSDFPTPGQYLDLVDGSFAHRSPVEAAVRWGATHIIVIEASTDERVPRGSLLANLGATLNFLYDQAQLIDVRARGKTKIYSLLPAPPHIGLLDFADNLISRGITNGYREARGESSTTLSKGAPFRRESGQPVFFRP